VSTDAPLLLCWSLALLFLLRALEGDGWADWLACGAVIGIGLMSKYTMAAFLPSALLLIILDPRHRRWLARPQPWVALLLAFAILSPNLYWNWTHDFPTFRHTAEITRVGHGERGLASGPTRRIPGRSVAFLRSGAGNTAGLGTAPQREPCPNTRPPHPADLHPALAVAGEPAGTHRPGQRQLGCACLHRGLPAGTGCIPQRAEALGRRRHRLQSHCIHRRLPLAGPGPRTGIELTAKNDPFKRARGWINLAEAVRPYLAAHPGSVLVAEDRELIAHLVYRLHPAEYAAWHPGGTPIDHYELMTTLSDKRGRDILYVGRKAEIPEIAARFASSEKLGKVVVPIHKDFRREVHVFLLRDFQGY
jgi:hypothetical protein